MPAGTYTINSANLTGWRPTTWICGSMPAGTYAIDTADMVNWRPTDWHCYSMPSGSLTFSAGSLNGWVGIANILANDNVLLSAAVDTALASVWAAFAARTAAGGTFNIGGTNEAPGGTFQAANPPTTGKEYAYELLNDSQNVNPTKKWATVTITA
jgi:hypothetical protein